MKNIYEILKKYGFMESEIKVYITLLQCGPLSGYEASKRSSVARSKVYGVLNSLQSKGLILSSSGEKSTLYKAESPEKVISMLKKSVMDDLNTLDDLFSNYEEPIDDEMIWSITDCDSIEFKLKELILNSKEEIHLQIWSDELSVDIEELLLKRLSEGIKVRVVLYDNSKNYETKIPNVFKHGFEDEKISELDTRWLNILVDKKAMLYSSIKNDQSVSGIYTKNRSMVFFASEYIYHDIYCLKLLNFMKELDESSYKKCLIDLRQD